MLFVIREAVAARLDAVIDPLWKAVMDFRCRTDHLSSFIITFFNPRLLSVPFLNDSEDSALRQLFKMLVDFGANTRKHIIIKLVSRCLRYVIPPKVCIVGGQVILISYHSTRGVLCCTVYGKSTHTVPGPM